ncbi:MAG TPA: hypothetical protein VD995_02065 [Azospirillum sp.]|nr:hypothetical protein [Azospirillum sp.]
MPGPTQPIAIDDRLVVAAALDRILYDDPERFSADDARTVRGLIPRARTPWLSLGFRAQSRGAGMSGQAAGVGQVDLKGEDTVVKGGIGEGPEWRCGQYKISNRGHGLEIWQVMSDEFDETPKGAWLDIDALGAPERLLFFQPRDIGLRIPFTALHFVIRLGGWREWKRPE